MRRSLLVHLLLALGLAAAGCAADTTACEPGTAGCECNNSGGCGDGSECRDSICVAVGDTTQVDLADGVGVPDGVVDTSVVDVVEDLRDAMSDVTSPTDAVDGMDQALPDASDLSDANDLADASDLADMMMTPMTSPGFSITGGGGVRESSAHRLRLSVGAPQPMGTQANSNYILSFGPRP